MATNLNKDRQSPDRALGGFWECQFVNLVVSLGMGCHRFAKAPSPIIETPTGPIILADCWLLQYRGASWLCEIKHKAPYYGHSPGGEYGFEQYRLHHIQQLEQWVNQKALYVIHNHERAGGRDIRVNRKQDWEVLPFATCYAYEHTRKAIGPSYVNGKKKMVPIYYWPARLWQPFTLWLTSEHA